MVKVGVGTCILRLTGAGSFIPPMPGHHTLARPALSRETTCRGHCEARDLCGKTRKPHAFRAWCVGGVPPCTIRTSWAGNVHLRVSQPLILPGADTPGVQGQLVPTRHTGPGPASI